MNIYIKYYLSFIYFIFCFFFVFFFFQAEDGIRDKLVTGVQTCALPISLKGEVVAVDGTVVRVDPDSLCIHGDTAGAVGMAAAVRAGLEEAGVELQPFRSEERRVGKECRSRWAPYH